MAREVAFWAAGMAFAVVAVALFKFVIGPQLGRFVPALAHLAAAL
jgi:hypothetical protein